MTAAKDRKQTAAVGYLRRSTKFTKRTASGAETESQKNSIPRQKAAVERLAKEHGYKIVRWYTDDGASGWKRGAQRPQFSKLMDDAETAGGFEAVLVDDLDRFSRDEVHKVIADLTRLAAAGVHTVHSVAQGKSQVGSGDIGAFVMLAIQIWGGNEESRRKARRIAETRAKLAKEGKRSGGRPPYGMKDDGQGGLLPGGKKEIRVVRWLFQSFADEGRSMAGLAKELNEQNLAGPQGGRWSTQVVKRLLEQEAYVGTLTYNRTKQGDFFVIHEGHRLVDAKEKKELGIKSWKATEEGVFRVPNMWPAIVSQDQFDRAQRRLRSFTETGRRPHDHTAILSGVLVCGHCGRRMFAARPKGRKLVYRCSSPPLYGTCYRFEIREELILPSVLQMLREEIDSLRHGVDTLAPQFGMVDGPDGRKREMLYYGNVELPEDQSEVLASLKERAAKLNKQIDEAAERILLAPTAQIRGRLDSIVSKWLDEYEILTEEIEKREKSVPENEHDRLRTAVFEWIDRAYEAGLVEVPLDDGGYLMCKASAVREALLSLGAEIRLRWEIQEKTTKTGRIRNAYTLRGGRFRLGVREQEMRFQFLNLPSAERDKSCFAEVVAALRKVDRVFGREILTGLAS